MELEYNMVQSNTAHFANPENPGRVPKEEAEAGWALIEKLDNYKIRLQRDISHRTNDANRTMDPYRVQVGPSVLLTYGVAAALTLLAVLAIFKLVGLF